MFLHLSADEVVVRLLSTVIGAGFIGLDRGEHGHTAGLRTTLLVALAACLAMLQANALLTLTGKTPESFSVMDDMRLPLGILSGIGFIGGGTIIRKGDIVHGLTTAASLWFVTVIGLCFGGGQLLIGWIGVGLGAAILIALRGVERQIPRELKGRLGVRFERSLHSEAELRKQILLTGMRIDSAKVVDLPRSNSCRVEWQLRWRANAHQTDVPEIVARLAELPGLAMVEWSP